MTKRERFAYLLKRGWTYEAKYVKPWVKDDELTFYVERHTFLGAFMRQQAIDARAEREADRQ